MKKWLSIAFIIVGLIIILFAIYFYVSVNPVIGNSQGQLGITILPVGLVTLIVGIVGVVLVILGSLGLKKH
jgi:hypothetical protein